MKFQKAKKSRAKLRLALSGPSGSGKTYSALRLAKGMGGKIAVIDTEHQSASLYADYFDFDTLTLEPPYSPERFIEAIQEAEDSGYDIIIIDSITHEWNGIGGCLESLNIISRAKYKGNSYMAWNEITPRHRSFIDKMLQSKCHIIATMRAKTAYVEVSKGDKKSYQKQGVEPEQREGIEFEFTCVLDLNNDGNYATASKDRTKLFTEPCVLSEDVGVKLIEWLNKGEEVKNNIQVAKTKLSEEEVHFLGDTLMDITSLQDLARRFAELVAIAKERDDENALLYFVSVKDRMKEKLGEINHEQSTDAA